MNEVAKESVIHRHMCAPDKKNNPKRDQDGCQRRKGNLNFKAEG